MKVAIFEFSLFGINTYVVYDPETKCCAVIDPGMYNQREENAIVDFIENNGLKLTHIINTHLHIDHAIGNAFLKEKYNTPVLAHEEDMPLASGMSQQAQMFGIPKEIKGVEITSFLQPGETIEIGNGRLEVIHVPGHSKGSVALYDKKDGFVIVGDALFNGSIGRTDLPGGNYNQLIESINDNLFKLPDETIVYSGHGPSTTIGREKRTNPFFL